MDEPVVIYVRSEKSRKDRELSYSIEDLEEIIDSLSLSLPIFTKEDVDYKPIIRTISLLTELKICVKTK